MILQCFLTLEICVHVMRKKIIDLSVSLEIGINSDPPPALPKIDYISHQDSAEHVCSFFPGLQKDDLPGGEGWA